MADKKEEQEAKEKKGGMMGLLVPMVGGGLGVFLFTIPIVLLSQGMIQFSGPHMRPAEEFVLADSLLAEYYVTEGLLSDEGLATVEAIQARKEEERRQVEQEEAAARQAELAAERAAAESPAGERQETVAAETTAPPDEAEIKTAEQELPFDREKLGRLVKVYEKMRAKQVAMILNTMPDEKAAMILASMKEKNAAEVLAAIEAKRAARLSELIVRMSSRVQ